ncbi:MAG: D-alanyl-D-alanine carboxypeptidase/D-alanyl-D-alanine-endopeptidase [Crocinitomicaceae bacterium]
MKHLILTVLTSCILATNFAQETTQKPNNVVQTKAESIMTFTKLKNAAFSFYAIDMSTGEVIGDYNSEMSIPSASTMKLVSTATALQKLGSGYRFKTKIMHSGEIDSTGTLHGDLYIIGGGDPTLGSKYFTKHDEERDFLTRWADSCYAMGIRKIDGHVIADASIYSYQGVPADWVWADMGNYYGAGPSGLTIFDNMMKLHFKTGENAGDSTSLECVTPYIPGIKIRNYVRSADSKKDNAYVYGAPYSSDWFVRGSIPKQKDDFEVKASMPDPELVMALEVDYALEQAGIDVMYMPLTRRELSREKEFNLPELKEIYIHKSPYLGTIINVTNRNSINLFAEHILCQISVNSSGYGSTYNGAQICWKYWNNKIGASGLNMTDGSGLARSNSLSAKFLVDMLKYMHRQKSGKKLKQSMALAGKRGTMSRMCRGTTAQGRVYGKSGTMTRVKSYAGYIDSKSGKKIAYAMIINNHRCSNTQVRKYFEKIMIALSVY